MKGIVFKVIIDRKNRKQIQVMVNKDKKYVFSESDFIDELEFRNLKVGDYIEFEIKNDKDGSKFGNCRKITDELKMYLIEKALTAPSEVIGYDEFCDNALAYAKRLKDFGVTTSMIRRIYSRILVAEEVIAVKRLRPQFAYTAGKNGDNPALKEFMEILDTIVKNMRVDDKTELKNFKQFMEAIVAYRKYVGDDNN